ncbi:MAG: VWA domain-containing protein [Thaumarchaeota archaeon]|nr:VWA domain-containing protein [Candidatus Calditenuaceae archaeon]MDW8042088.1 VWA domain-containing protein [Nitrososphaerota archaeon]
MDAYRFVVEVANLLRERQLKVGVSESLDACQALCFVSSYGLPEIKTAIKVTMLKDPSKFHLLEEVFQRAVADASSESEGGEEGDQTGEGRERGTQSYSAARAAQDQNRGQQQDKTVDVYMYSPMETLHRRALKPIDPLRVRTGRRVIRRMKRRLALLEGRRYRRSTRGELDFPKTMKSALGTAAELMELKRSSRILARLRVVAFFDISGSMDTYTEWIVRAMYLVKRLSRRVEVFAFSTRLMRITDLLETTNLDEIRRRLSERIDLWGSGTRIGICLRTFLERYGTLVDRSWVVIVVSDGWDTGEPEVLRESLEGLKARAGKLVWLNPHADKPNFKPMTVGMLTALPYIDVLAGTSTLEDMNSFIRFFGKSIKPLKSPIKPVF